MLAAFKQAICIVHGQILSKVTVSALQGNYREYQAVNSGYFDWHKHMLSNHRYSGRCEEQLGTGVIETLTGQMAIYCHGVEVKFLLPLKCNYLRT